MANPTTEIELALSLPVIHDLSETIMNLHKIWDPVAGVFVYILSNMGEGKTSTLHGVAATIPTLFLNAQAFCGDHAEMIPLRDPKKGVIKLSEVLNEELLDFAKSVSNDDGTLKPETPIPIIVADEFTMVDVRYRDKMVTAIVDGVWFDRHGFKWRPMFVALGNGKTFAPESNKSLSSREIARLIQFIYIQSPNPDPWPGMRPDYNDPLSVQERTEYLQEIVRAFSEGSTKIPDKELPRNILGNNRSTDIFIHMVEQMKVQQINVYPKKFAAAIGKGYFAASSQPAVARRITYMFSALPKSVEAMHQIIASGQFPEADGADWISWAEQFKADPVAHAEAKEFAKKAGCPKEVFNAIVGSTLQR